jgi:hypothetical protein
MTCDATDMPGRVKTRSRGGHRVNRSQCQTFKAIDHLLPQCMSTVDLGIRSVRLGDRTSWRAGHIREYFPATRSSRLTVALGMFCTVFALSFNVKALTIQATHKLYRTVD